jgi:type IV pilus assembly protein PilA
MTKKLNNKKGFTLAELLVVVAIIAVLVAVSIPIFSAQTKKANLATNQANARAAKAAAVTQVLGGDTTATYYYDTKAGTISATKPTVTTTGTAITTDPQEWTVGDTKNNTAQLETTVYTTWQITMETSGTDAKPTGKVTSYTPEK